MTMKDIGGTGAKAVSFNAGNYRFFVRQHMRSVDNPADVTGNFTEYEAALKQPENVEVQRSSDFYAYKNAVDSMLSDELKERAAAKANALGQPAPAPVVVNKKTSTTELKAQGEALVASTRAKTAIIAAKSQVLMATADFVFSLSTSIAGKALGDYTFGEIKAIGGRLTKLGESGPSDVLVSAMMTDEKIKALV